MSSNIQNFLSILDNVEFKKIPGLTIIPPDSEQFVIGEGVSSLITAIENRFSVSVFDAINQLNGFFSNFGQSQAAFPSSWDGFITSFLVNVLGDPPPTPPNLVFPTSVTRTGDIYEAFVYEYKSIVGYPLDFSQISPTPTESEIESQFVNSFGAFISNYPYTQNENHDLFASAFHRFLALTSDVDGTPPVGVTLATYENIYNAFIPPLALLAPGLTFRSYSEALTEFYQEQLIKTSTNHDEFNPNGFFIPSQAFSDWIVKVQQDYSKFLSGTGAMANTSVTTEATKGVIIIDRLILLLISMLNTMQNVAAAQAQRLNFLTQWQKAYTDSSNQIHFFSQGTDNIDDPGSDDAKSARDNMNQVNQTYTQQLQGNRSVIQDDAKALQSNVNQSNDSVTQQTSLLDGIFQQLSTILSSIYR